MVEPSFVRGHGRRRARRTYVSPSLWTPFPFRPVHAWLVWCWPACVWSVYGQVAAAAAVLLVRGRLGRLMVGLVCVGSIALLPVVVPPHVVYAAGMSVSVLVSGVVVCPSVVSCSLLPLVGRVCIGSVVVFCCVRGYDRRWAWRTKRSLPEPAPAVPLPPVIPADLLRINACIYQNPGSKTKNIENRKYNPPSTLNGNQIPQSNNNPIHNPNQAAGFRSAHRYSHGGGHVQELHQGRKP